MRRSMIALIGSAVLGCTTSGTRTTTLGNDPSLVPAVPWQEFGRYDFTVELARPGHVAVLQLVNTSGKNTLTLLYPDSTTPLEASQRVEVSLAGPSQSTTFLGAQRVARRCIDTSRMDADLKTAYRWGCAWTLETAEAPSPLPRRGDGLNQTYYLVVAFDAPHSVEALRAAAQQVDAERKPADVARQLGVALVGGDARTNWGATLQLVP